MMPAADRKNAVLLFLGGFFGLTGVIAGALGAHGLEGTLTESALQSFRTASTYQVFHALALIAVAALAAGRRQGVWVVASGVCFTVGVVLFSGSIYALTLLQWRALGPITPIGGLFLMVGWFTLMVEAIARFRQ